MEPLKSIKALGKNYNIKTVQNVMQENDIIAKLRRRFKTKKQPNNMVIALNILDQNFITEQPNKVWDYLYKNQGRLLAAIILTHGS
ncbi:transposase [Wolbachia endosymbiont (group B) of Ennomos erosarius]|uniref:transposase n=1 Tax=Wolbachia endosymbiont (group B) of Ennomos erosarius TaxID=3066175 RepID=UPI0031330262